MANERQEIAFCAPGTVMPGRKRRHECCEFVGGKTDCARGSVDFDAKKCDRSHWTYDFVVGQWDAKIRK